MCEKQQGGLTDVTKVNSLSIEDKYVAHTVIKKQYSKTLIQNADE